MPIHLIIDGYNVLGRVGGLSGPIEPARESMLQALAEYQQRKLHPITIVFDGWKQRDPSERREHRAGVLVVYSRRGERADQVIQRLAREYGADAAVVTSDREVARSAQASGAFVMGAQEFALKLWPVPERGGLDHKELEGKDEDAPPRDPKKKGNPRKLSKAQRARARQLKRF